MLINMEYQMNKQHLKKIIIKPYINKNQLKMIVPIKKSKKVKVKLRLSIRNLNK